MGLRVDLQSTLQEIMGDNRVYFQPPENVTMEYPCIRYSRSTGNTRFADNSSYTFDCRYEIILIDEDPDSEFFEPITQLKSCTFERHYVSDGLNHDVFYLYF